MSSILVSEMIADAALAIGDPNKTRVTTDQWLLFYNRSLRELCERANVLQYVCTFDLLNEPRLAYPDDLTQLTKVEVNPDPTDETGWILVNEIFEDEFRNMTNTRYPTGSWPLSYFSEPGWLWLVPQPETQIIGGGRITYFGLPDKVTDYATGTFQLPNIASDYVVSRMLIHVMQARNRLNEAQFELKRWYSDLEGLEDKLIDRADDRRSTIAPRKNRYAGMR